MSHLFFSLSLSLLSRFEDEERENERENRLSLYRSIAKSAFCVVFFYSRDGAKALNEPIFFFKCFPLSYFERSTHQTFLEARRRRRRREEEERRYQEEDFSLGKKNKRLDLNFFLSLFFTSRSLLRSFFFRERERKREFSSYALKTL